MPQKSNWLSGIVTGRGRGSHAKYGQRLTEDEIANGDSYEIVAEFPSVAGLLGTAVKKYGLCMRKDYECPSIVIEDNMCFCGRKEGCNR